MRFAVLLALSITAVGCTDVTLHEDDFVQSELAGSVRIPLTATDESGTTYQLRNATFEISGSAMLTLNDASGRREELVTELPPGEYGLFLRPGWEIVAVAADGTAQPAEANLVSLNPTHFAVAQMSDATVKLDFNSSDKRLSFGPGTPVRVTTVAGDQF